MTFDMNLEGILLGVKLGDGYFRESREQVIQRKDSLNECSVGKAVRGGT